MMCGVSRPTSSAVNGNWEKKRGADVTVKPKFELLEDRIVLDGADPNGADPVVTFAGPEGGVELGQQDVNYTLTFDNDGGESGYVPYAELIIPTSGGDGEGDGPSFDSASFLGSPIATTELTFDAAGEVDHPFLTNPDGSPLVVTGGMPGDTLVVFELPYGSFSPGNPPVDIDVIIDFSDQADLGSAPTFQALGGFALGCDPLDNPTTDAPIRGDTDTLVQNPRLFNVGKTSSAPEFEAATGPSYVYQYTLTVDIAPNQTLSNFTLTDNLPPEVVFLGNVNISGGTNGQVSAAPTIGSQVQPGEQLIVDFDDVSGNVTVTFDYYISNDPSDRATPTNDPTTGAPTSVDNSVTGTGTWVPLDPDDDPITPSDSASNTTTASALAIQKSNALIADNNAPGNSPGDVYEFTLNVQVSDYFSFGDLSIEDILGDGWDYVDGSAEFFIVEEAGNIGSAGSPISLTSNETVSDNTPGTGETTLVWDISQAMIDQGGDGLLVGDIAGDGASSGTQTTITITYQAAILSAYAGGVPGDVFIGQGDNLGNSVTVTGEVRDNPSDGGDPNIPTGNTLSEVSLSEVIIPRGAIESKEVFALNGDTNPPSDVVIAAGDQVTFAITYRAPIAVFEDFRIEDNLPQLVFDSAGEFAPATTWIPNPADRTAPPPAGMAYFGSNTSTDILAAVPTISTDGPNNGLIFDFGNFAAATPEEAVIEILFTATVEDALFADDLLLTNQATAFETNSFGEEIFTTAIAQFDYGEPVLNISKGVVASSSTDPETALTGSVGLSGVTVPDTGSPRFSGTVASGTKDGSPIDVDANIENIDAGDIVTFAIVIENEGRAPNGAFNVTVTDTLPAGFEIPGSGLNLSITDGAGTAIGFTRPDGTAATADDLFTTGLMLVDDAPLQGAISQFNETSGENVVVITYDLLVSDDVTPNETLTNTAGIATYNAFEGNGLPFDVNAPENRVVDPIQDDATATTEDIEISKTRDGRQFDGIVSGRNGVEVVVGEEFEFLIRLDVPEGELLNTVISDRVTNGGMRLISAEIETMGTNFVSSTGLVQGNTTLANAAGTDWSFDFGTLTNTGDNDSTNDFLEIRVFVSAPDDQVGAANHFMRNLARIDYQNASGQTFNARDAEIMRLIEPNIDLDKTATPASVEAGEVISYEVDINNGAGFRDAPAFDLTLSDVLDPNVTLNTGSITILLNGAPQTVDGVNFGLTTNVGGDPNAFNVFIDRLDQGDTITVQYEATVSSSIPPGLTIPNTASLVFDSTPEDDSGADGDDREYSLTDDAEVVSAQPEIDKEIVSGSSSYAETDDPDLGIGELVTYEFTIVIPEGFINEVELVDTLPSGMEYVSSQVVRVGTGPGTNIGGSSLAAGASGTNTGGQDTTFTFGNLTNVNDMILNQADEIVVQITARVTDAAVSGDVVNQGVLTFRDGDGNLSSVSDTATATVGEPDVTLAKSVSPAVVDAGDTATYTLTATNSGDGPAYDMVITDDVIGADFTEVGTATITITDGSGGTYTHAEAPSFSFDGVTGALEVVVPDLPAGHVVTITYDVVVEDTALFSSQYTNTAQITRYDSNPAGDETTPPAAPEDERVYTGNTVTQDVSTPDASLEKAFLSSNNADTTGTNLNIGEEVTYELTITVPQGTAGIVLQDNLPTGLLAQSATVVSIGDDTLDTSTNLTAGDDDTNANVTITGARDQVTFDFGTVVIDGTADAAAVDTTIVVRVTAIVEDNAAIDAGDMLTNTANLTVTNPAGGAVLDTDSAQETVRIVEPDLEIEKTGPVGADPGEFVTYSISVTNNGDGPAYDANITDDFADSNLIYQAGTAQVFLNNVLLTPQPTIAEPAPTATDGFQVQDLELQPNDVIRVDFTVQIDPLAPDAQTFVNTATVDYDSVEGNPTDVDGNPLGRDDSDTDTHSLATVPRIEKTPVASQFTETGSVSGSSPFNLSIGEEVTFRYQITLPEVPLDSVVATDTLPTGMEYVSVNVVAVNGTGASGAVTATPDGLNPNIITFDFGSMTNASDGSIGPDDILVFDVVARITEAASAGDTLTNSVDLDVTPTGGSAFGTQTTTAAVQIVEPDLSIDKTGPLALSPGGAAGTFTITVTNDGVTGAEGPAYDLDISDSLPAGMTLNTGSFTFADGSGGTLTPESFTANASSFLAEFPVLDVGESIVITYTASLNAGETPLTTFENTASADFFSAPDDLLGEDGNPVAEDYTPVTDSHITSTIPTLEKDATSTGTAETPENADADTELEATIGETITYDLTLTLPEIPMDTVALTDTLPAGLSFVSAEVTALGSEITLAGSTDLTAINAGATITTAGQAATISLADVVNSYVDGTILAAEDAITIQITARVEDVGTNVGLLPNTQLTNSADLVVTPQGEAALAPVTATETIEIVEPSLTVDKTGTVAVNPGDPVDYTVTITNDGTSPAFDVIVADAVDDTFLTYQSGSVVIDLDGSDITAQVTVTETATGFTFELDDTATGDPIPIPVGGVLTVTYSADLDPNAPDAQSFVNQVFVDYDSLPGDPVDENGNPVDDREYSTSDINSVATVPFLTKTPFTSNFTETDSENGSDPFELSIGEEVTYRYQLYLPEIDMDSVVFEDALPAGLEFVSFNVVSFGSDMSDLSNAPLATPALTLISDQEFILDFGGIRNLEDTAPPTIGADDIITLDVVARVTNDGAASAGDTLQNTALLEVNPTSGNPLNTAVATADVTIVEPLLEIDKSGPATADPGDTVTYTINVTNVGDPNGAGPAYDVEIEDILPTGLSLNTGSLTFTINGSAETPVSQSATSSGFSAEFAVIEANETLQITYTVQMGAGVTPVASFENTVMVAYDSAPGDPVNGNGDPAEQTYSPVSDNHVLSTGPDLEKRTLSSEFVQTPFDNDGDLIPDLAIGEAMTYQLVLTLPDTSMDSVVLADTLPAGMEFVSGSVSAIGSEITINGTTSVTSVGSNVIVSLTDVVNAFGDSVITEAEDAIIIEIVARATDVPANVDGTTLTNSASLVVTPTGEAPLDPVVDTATVEIIEPNVDVTKAVSDPEPDLGDTISYTFVISNDPTATAPAFNTVLTDNLPSGLTLTGNVSLSNPALGTVSPSSGSGATSLVINIPILQPGETLTVVADVFVGYSTAVLEDVVNTGTLTAGTTPIPNDPNSRSYTETDTASFEAQPTPFPGGERPVRAVGGIDDAQFLPILLIDPIFTGTAEPGSNVTINLYRQDGSLDYVRNIVADTGGHWIAIFPRVQLNAVADDFHQELAGSVLFDAPIKYIDSEQSDLFLGAVQGRELSVGSDLLDEAYTLGVSVDRPSTLPQDASLFNTRTYFAPAHIGEIYGIDDVLSVDEIFQDIAFRTVEEMYQGTSDPLGVSLNRFNFEFLSSQTAVPGLQ